MTRFAATDLRKNFSDALNRVAFGNETILIERNGKDIAAMIPLEELAFLRKLEEEYRKKKKLEGVKNKINSRYSKTFQRLADE